MLAKGLKVLVIGGGFSGMTAAIQLRKAGADVEIVEIDPGWRSYGAGITLGGATLESPSRDRRSRRIPEARRRSGRARSLHRRRTQDRKHSDAAPRRPGCSRCGRHHAAGPRRHSRGGHQGCRNEGSARKHLQRDRRRPRQSARDVQRRLAGELRSRDRRGRALLEDAEGDFPRRPHAPLHRAVRVARRCASHG